MVVPHGGKFNRVSLTTKDYPKSGSEGRAYLKSYSSLEIGYFTQVCKEPGRIHGLEPVSP